jgi:outer membrane beta-barrel protein
LASKGEILLDLSRHTFASLILLCLAPALVRAQTRDEPGLDLTEPSPPKETRPAEAPPLPPPPSGTTQRPRENAATAEAPIAPGESDVALGDRVKAVQLKGFLKRHRFELGVAFPFTVNDAFYEKLGVSGKLAYNLEDSFALQVRGGYYWQLRSDHVREGKLAFSSQLLQSRIYGQAMLDGVWSPVYGKVAWLGSSIVHFDLYLLAGFGAVWSATSLEPRNEGPHIATDLGGGIRFYPSDWLALDAGLIGTFYPDQPSTSAPSSLQRVLSAQVGFTVFLPLTFEYSHP